MDPGHSPIISQEELAKNMKNILDSSNTSNGISHQNLKIDHPRCFAEAPTNEQLTHLGGTNPDNSRQDKHL